MKTGDSERALELEFKRRWVVSGRLFRPNLYFVFLIIASLIFISDCGNISKNVNDFRLIYRT
jgi:hypothetical protein